VTSPPDPHTQEMEELLQGLWKKNYGILLERVQTIRDAQNKLAAGALDNQSRSDAEGAAHKLAGILGTFGLPHGSAMAAKIEARFSRGIPAGVESASELGAWIDELAAIIASHP
jgi:HPt (histidine-containing phosphotransfer) domain-containing protein